jgi:DNA-binding transcriptional LysR family regulator
MYIHNHYKYFMLVAEKLNMSGVARDSFISHQCVSTYIRQLEEKLNVKLFHRRPSLSLTREGEILRDALQQIRIIEDGITSKLTEDKNVHRKIRIGILSSRYSTLVQLLLPKYKNMYPNVEIEVIGDFSNALEAKTANGNLDLFIGHGRSEAKTIDSVNLISESYYLLICDTLLRRYFNVAYPNCIASFMSGINLAAFAHVPFILHPHPSRVRRMIDNISVEKHFDINVSIQMNSTEMFPQLCHQQLGTSIISQMFFPQIREINNKPGNGERLYAFPVIDLIGLKSEIFISFIKQKYIPVHRRDFIKLSEDIFSAYKDMTFL